MLVAVVPVLVLLHEFSLTAPAIPLQYSVGVPLGLGTAVVRAYDAPYAGDYSLCNRVARRTRTARHRICVHARVRCLLFLDPRFKRSAPL